MRTTLRWQRVLDLGTGQGQCTKAGATVCPDGATANLTTYLGPKACLIVIGAGHLVLLCLMVLRLGFEVIVCDPREEHRVSCNLDGAVA